MKLRILFSTILFIVVAYSAMSQGSLDDFNYQIKYVTTGDINTSGDSTYARECSIILTDTTIISNIHVKIGSEDGLSDVLYQVFQFDNYNGYPNGLAYVREGYEVRLMLFETQSADMYFYEVQMEDTQGNYSQIKKWY